MSKIGAFVELDRKSGDYYKPKEGNTKNYVNALENIRQGMKGSFSSSCPISIRHITQAQHSYRASDATKGYSDGEGIRTRNFWCVVFKAPGSTVYHVARAALRTIFLPITFFFSLYQQNKYGIAGWAKEELKRCLCEWIDLGTATLSIPIGLINTLYPNAINMDFFRDYYMERNEKTKDMNTKFKDAQKQFISTQEAQRTAYEKQIDILRGKTPAQKPVVSVSAPQEQHNQGNGKNRTHPYYN